MLSRADFRRAVVEMIQRAETTLPRDVVRALERCRQRERGVARPQLDCMLENLRLAREAEAPICQDTGTFTFFLRLGRGLELGFDPAEAIRDAVRQATRSVPLRQTIVDPLTRKSAGANIGKGRPATHLELVGGKGLELDLLIKGAGTENWSRLYMLKPLAGAEAIERSVLLTLSEAGGQPCPPTIVGVGVGGSPAEACLLSRRALLRPLDKPNPEARLAKLERRLTEAADALGIGPMGLGGRTTVLGVHIEAAGCHLATLPVAVSLQCWAARRARARFVGKRVALEVP